MTWMLQVKAIAFPEKGVHLLLSFCRDQSVTFSDHTILKSVEGKERATTTMQVLTAMPAQICKIDEGSLQIANCS